jgi:hypothetical protein
VSLTRPNNPIRVGIVGGILLIGVTALIIGGAAQVNGPATIQRNPEIVQLFPNESDQLLPQGEVGAQLRANFNAQISIDGRIIPQDQITATAGANTVLFDPGPGKDITEFSKGGHTAVLEWWPPLIKSPEQARAQRQLRSYTWTFNVG